MDEIRLPTLDELESWWLAHPNESAVPGDACNCVIAVPMNNLGGGAEWWQVNPSEERGWAKITDADHKLLATLTLTPMLNALGIEFDATEGDGRYYGDNIEDDDEDAEEKRVCSERIITLIRQFKAVSEAANVR